MIGRRGLALIKEHEGLRLTSYLDPVGVATVGYGSTRNVRLGMEITEEEAESRLREDVLEAASAVNLLVRVKLTESMRDALISWTFNLGAKKLRISTLLRKLNEKRYEEIPNEIKRWTFGRVNGEAVTLPGLVRRRNDEAALFLADGFPTGAVFMAKAPEGSDGGSAA